MDRHEAYELRQKYQVKTFYERGSHEIIALSRGDTTIKIPTGTKTLSGKDKFVREVIYINEKGLVLNDPRGTGFLDSYR